MEENKKSWNIWNWPRHLLLFYKEKIGNDAAIFYLEEEGDNYIRQVFILSHRIKTCLMNVFAWLISNSGYYLEKSDCGDRRNPNQEPFTQTNSKARFNEKSPFLKSGLIGETELLFT